MNAIRLIVAFCIAMAIAFLISFYEQNYQVINVIALAAVILLGFIYAWYKFVKIPGWRRARISALKNKIKEYGGSATSGTGLFLLEKDYTATAVQLECELLNAAARRIVEKYGKVLARKKSQMLYANDYGRIVEKGWHKELNGFVIEILLSDLCEAFSSDDFESAAARALLDSSQNSVIEYWCSFVEFAISGITPEAEAAKEFDEILSGHEYESFIAGLINKLGWSATVTPGSGDHGADIIAEKDGERIAIQCKMYSNAVGNKSVQEAFSAKAYYDCNFACVVSNSSYTPAAKKAAAKLGVTLLHHDDLEDYLLS